MKTESRATGVALIVLTVLIWASFALSMRFGGRSAAVMPADMALARYLIPSLFFAPFLPRAWGRLRAVRPAAALMMAAGSGLPYYLFVYYGGRLTSAAHVSAILAGCLPLSMQIVRLALGERAPLSTVQRVGLAIIVAGTGMLVLGLGLHTDLMQAVLGALLLFGGSIAWAFYTIGVARSGGDPLVAGILGNMPSAAIVLIAVAIGAVPVGFGQYPALVALQFSLIQGLGSGIVAGITFTMAVRRIGAMAASVYGALAPVLVALLGWPILGERPVPATLAGVGAICIGVALCNGALGLLAHRRGGAR
ncbi:MAG: DMT family transporter [Paenirhodobacter sp.]|uniref:DMT family transporter n=1 Tax=Paenirhodobacter sp. TaxID=1965326 RepID=UPI003D0C13E2